MPAARFSDLTGQRAFMRFWVARLFGTTGNQMLMVAIGWQMYDLTASAWDLGLVGLMQFLPSLALVLVAGHALDRYHRARILAACMALQAIVALLLMLGAWHGFASRTLLLGLSVAIGAAKLPSTMMVGISSGLPKVCASSACSSGRSTRQRAACDTSAGSKQRSASLRMEGRRACEGSQRAPRWRCTLRAIQRSWNQPR